MLSIQINNPNVENYFKDSKTINKVLNYIATKKIPITNEELDLNQKLHNALNEVDLMLKGKLPEKNARDFLNEL